MLSNKHQTNRLKKLYELSMTIAGDPIEVFGHIARIIGELFELRVVCLSKVNGNKLDFLAVYLDGQIHINAGQCELSVTPCATVEETKDVKVYDRVKEKFPEAKFLEQHNAHSYCGFPSIGNDGKVKAVTCLLDDKAREFDQEDIEILRVFGQRIAMEIERHELISLSKAAQKHIEFLAHHDELTKLPNRRLLSHRLSLEIEYAKRHKAKTGLMLLDLDQFKNVNDTFGHQVGDQLLSEVSSKLKSCVNELDTVARLGGDEFAIILNKVSDSSDPASTAERIISALNIPIIVNNNKLRISASIGIAIYPDDGLNPESLMKCADTAMYHAKASGRNNYKFFTSKLNQTAHERMEIEFYLREAIEHSQLALFYQPKIGTNPTRLVGCEALIRWNHPVLGMVPPNKFIPIAENSGLMIMLGAWVIQEAVNQAKSWANMGFDIHLAINISGKQLHDDSFVDKVTQSLTKLDNSNSLIEFEITESTLMHGVDIANDTLKKLSSLGISIAVDDFGTGYSSLAYLKSFSVDTLKIDQSFVRDIMSDPNDAAIVRAIISLSHELGIKVVAEGVETERQVQFLSDLGCDILQGYYFSKPLPNDQFLAFVTSEFPEALTKR